MSFKKWEDAEDWMHIPAFLSPFQRADPLANICRFTNWETLYEMRNRILYLFQAAMGSSLWKDDEPEGKEDKMWLMEELIMLIESSYLLDEMIDKGKIVYKINPI